MVIRNRRPYSRGHLHSGAAILFFKILQTLDNDSGLKMNERKLTWKERIQYPGSGKRQQTVVRRKPSPVIFHLKAHRNKNHRLIITHKGEIQEISQQNQQSQDHSFLPTVITLLLYITPSGH
ncbi:uncharacterized [Tachysurus ichikawai]